MANTDFSIKGLKEIEDDMKKVVEAYPIDCQATLIEQGKAFKKFAASEYKGEARTAKNLTKGFTVSPPEGAGVDMYVSFSAESGKKNPHWHLIENGHEIVMPFWKSKRKRIRNRAGGENRGFVPGAHAMPKIREKYFPVFIAAAEELIDRLLKKGDMT
jgi:hypothetical protein